MLVTRINPEWTWPRANKIVIADDVTNVTDVTASVPIRYKLGKKATIPHERPALHRSLMRSFAEYLDDGDQDRMITKWYQDHGPLTIDGNVDSFIEEASIAWWTVTILDRFGGIGAYSNETAIEPGELEILAADQLFLTVPDHLGRDDTETLPYSALLAAVIRHINQHLDENVTLINEEPWDIPRNRFGKKDPSNLGQDDTTTHKISTVAQPRNLSGYIWLRIQHQLEETPNINYYPCGNFEECNQELPIRSDVSRRKWCSNACRMSKKTRIATKVDELLKDEDWLRENRGWLS